jgi:hypothetical protein
MFFSLVVIIKNGKHLHAPTKAAGSIIWLIANMVHFCPLYLTAVSTWIKATSLAVCIRLALVSAASANGKIVVLYGSRCRVGLWLVIVVAFLVAQSSLIKIALSARYKTTVMAITVTVAARSA